MSEPEWPGTTLVSTAWLAGQLGAPDLAVVDASWYLPSQNRDPWSEFLAAHVPRACFFDIDAIADSSTALPHMLPSAEVFASTVGAMGIGDDMRIVVYDSQGLYSAPRVWWTFLTFGAERVAVLDGGLPRWRAEGRPVESGEPLRPMALFDARLRAGAVADAESVARVLADGSAQVVDARPEQRFRGEAPEPRKGVRSGHMPGALNLPFDRLVENGSLLPPDRLRARIAESGLDFAEPVITSCGSGVTAAVLSFALATLGKTDVALYDGSWSEWGSREDLPAIKGP